MVMDGNKTFGSDHFVIEMLNTCIPGTYVML